MPVLLANLEKAGCLTKIALPSQSWFYGYLRWFEAQPDQGQAVIVGRHGQAMWDREFMVFDTFVYRAVRLLAYVFADHWLLDLFIVDEATRRRLDRLWLTLLLDAYSRSVVGLALLYEAPCIESIQSALRHAIIWPLARTLYMPCAILTAAEKIVQMYIGWYHKTSVPFKSIRQSKTSFRE